jgi:UDP-glucose 4-epimerase
VVAVDDLSGGLETNLVDDPRNKFVRLNLNQYEAFLELVSSVRPRVIYHFAAYAAEGLSPFIRRFNYESNLLASASVINAAIQYDSKVVFTSSMAVYGNQSPPFREELDPSPVDPYGIAKTAVEMDLNCAQAQHGLNFSIVRPHNVLGPGQNIWDRYRNVVGIFIRKALAGEPLTVYGDGQQRRAFSDVQYYLEPLEQLASVGNGETYNLGSDEDVTVLDLARLVCNIAKTFGISASIEHLENRHEVEFAYCDHAKAKDQLAFADHKDLEDVIRRMFIWALNEPVKEVKSLAYELDRGIYSYWV